MKKRERAGSGASLSAVGALGDFLRVLDSERSLFGAEDQLVDSQRAVTENLVALYKALGGGWETTLLAKNNRTNP